MPKLHLKRTPAEEAEHQWKKARRAERKAARKRSRTFHNLDHDEEYVPAKDSSSSYKRPRTQPMPEDSGVPMYEDLSDDMEYGPPPPPLSRSHKIDYESMCAEVEEERFRDKLWGALGEDERLDSVEARLNDFIHLPKRWRDDYGKGDESMTVDPRYMDDDEYVEWVRASMWK
jgi:hypothetical protein